MKISHALIAAPMFLLNPSCCMFFPEKCCKVELPPTSDSRSTDATVKAAADALSSAVINGSVEGNIKRTVTQTYNDVDDDLAFFFLLQAANCESMRGNHAAAESLRTTAREELMVRRNRPTGDVEKAPNTLTPTESRILDTSPLKKEIIDLLPSPTPTTLVEPPPTVAPVGDTPVKSA